MRIRNIVLGLSLCGLCFGAVVKQEWKTLDPANLDTINRQTRKSLLDKITNELSKAKANLDLVQPQIIECQEKINQTLGPCTSCVNDHCKQRYDQCAIDLNLPVNGGGVSLFSTNVDGKSKITVCTIVQQSKSCSTIMSPNQIFVSSVSNMGDILRVNLQSAITDLGSNIVTFIGNAQNFVRGINDTEVAPRVDEIFNQLQTSQNGINHGVHSMVDGMNSQLTQMADGLASGLQMMELGLSQMVNGFNRHYTDLSTQYQQDRGLMRNDMSHLGSSLGTLGHTIGSTVNRLLGSIFYGRKKRAVNVASEIAPPEVTAAPNMASSTDVNMAGIPTDVPMVEIPGAGALLPPSDNLDCLLIVENTTACSYYKNKCPACSDVIHSTKDDIMKKVCGATIVQKANTVKEQVQELTEIYDQVLSARDLIMKVEFDKSSFDEITMSFNKVFVTADIRGKPTRFQLTSSELTMLDLKRTANDLANQILRKWLPPSV